MKWTTKPGGKRRREAKAQTLGQALNTMLQQVFRGKVVNKAKHADLGIDAEWRHNFDVAVLATFMGVPKEGPSAGITIVTGIVSALKGQPVRNDLAMTGEITTMGKVLPVGGIQQNIRAACDAGIKEVLLPADNLDEAKGLPAYVLTRPSRNQVGYAKHDKVTG